MCWCFFFFFFKGSDNEDVFICSCLTSSGLFLSSTLLSSAHITHSQVDSGLGEQVVVLKVPGLPGNRLVFASTGPVNRDYDDIRRFSDAAGNGIKRCVLLLKYIPTVERSCRGGGAF